MKNVSTLKLIKYAMCERDINFILALCNFFTIKSNFPSTAEKIDVSGIEKEESSVINR